MTAGPLPQLYPEVPGAPRVETQQYRFPPARPHAPAAADCTEDDLLELAADALRNDADLWALLGSREHVRRICELVERQYLAVRDSAALAETLASQLEIARGVGRTLETRLDAARDYALTETAERNRLAALHDRISQENVYLRHQLAGTTPAGVTIAIKRAAMAEGSSPDATARLNEQLRGLPTDGRFDDSDTEVIDLTMLGGGL